jgi:hypothetical protein
MGPWLTEEGREKWDVLAVTPQDRLSCDDLHFMAFVRNVLDWGKTLVVLNDPSFDISTETGRLIAYAKATQAAAELRKIRQRRAASFRRCIRVDGASGAGAGPRVGRRGLTRRQARLPVIMRCRVPDHHDARPCLPARPRSSRALWADSPTLHRPCQMTSPACWPARLRCPIPDGTRADATHSPSSPPWQRARSWPE